MPRKSGKRDEEYLYNLVVEVFRHTAPQERFEVAQAWCTDFTVPHTLAKALGLPPIALVIAALIDIKHPLISSERPNVTMTYCEVEIQKAVLRQLPVAIPICPQNLSTGDVDSMCTVVDKCVFVHRDSVER